MKPVFLYLKYYRYLEHVGIHEDFDAGYRDKKEFEKWIRKDPLKLQLKKLRNLGLSNKETDKTRGQIEAKIELSLKKAKRAKFPDPGELVSDVYEN